MTAAIWPDPSPPSAFAERRRRLGERFKGPALFASGTSRPRNFAGNRYPFRAESHFLYLVGRAIEGAALLIDGPESVLFAHPPDPEAALWTGAEPSLEQLSEALGVRVRSIEEVSVPAHTAVLPPQDADTAFFLEDLLDRDVDPGGGTKLDGADAALADAMIELRLFHDAAAIAQLRQAAAATAIAHRAGMAATRPGLREAAVRAAMEAGIIASGMGCSYGSIVTVHGEVLHNVRYDNVIDACDLVLADVGAETPEGWAGDVTRTWPASGRFSATQRALYEHVLDAQLAAIDAVKPGVRYLDVHRVAGRRLLAGLVEEGIFKGDVDGLYERGAAALFFPHGVGHLLGLDVHDMEDLGDRAGYAPGRKRIDAPGDRYLRLDRDLAPGMAVTIEPGYYRIDAILSNPDELGDLAPDLDRDALARFSDVRGIRIEDDVLVTPDGREVLTRDIPKTVAEIEAAIGRA